MVFIKHVQISEAMTTRHVNYAKGYAYWSFPRKLVSGKSISS